MSCLTSSRFSPVPMPASRPRATPLVRTLRGTYATFATFVSRARIALLGLALMGGLALPAGNAHALDVNQADASQLQTMRGIGPSMAQRILTERDRNGPFATLEALRERVRGIGEKKLQSLREAGLSAGAGQSMPAGAATGAAPSGTAGSASARSSGATPGADPARATPARAGKEGAASAPAGRARPPGGAAAIR
ncbi:ComEA family DNA-binding protein [Pseudomonadota bacterium AL_CKDN230030165-1A_HGKHYDSX7]